jgi:hypothetical protein
MESGRAFLNFCRGFACLRQKGSHDKAVDAILPLFARGRITIQPTMAKRQQWLTPGCLRCSCPPLIYFYLSHLYVFQPLCFDSGIRSLRASLLLSCFHSIESIPTLISWPMIPLYRRSRPSPSISRHLTMRNLHSLSPSPRQSPNSRMCFRVPIMQIHPPIVNA